MTDEIDELLDMVRQNEREHIVLWLVGKNADIEMLANMGKASKWRVILWAAIHPARFAAAAALAEAGTGIFKGQHRANPSPGA